jgi:hypothetical protein
VIVPPTGIRVLVAMKPVDFRKGMDGLAAHVQEVFKVDPFTEAKAASLAAEVDRLTARAARLDHILSVLRRAQFGCRSEHISDEQIELALEDVETQHGVEDAGTEKADAIIKAEGVKSRRANRGHLPPHLPRGDRHRAGGQGLPVLRRHAACHRRRRIGAARQDSGTAARDRDAAAEIRLP